jgi:outer membrane protein assembly factor BamB
VHSEWTAKVDRIDNPSRGDRHVVEHQAERGAAHLLVDRPRRGGKTGEIAWQIRAAEGSRGYSFTMAPLVADGKVIVGVAGGEFEIRGFVDAYDAKTGARVWRFWTIPSPADGGWWGTWATTTPEGDKLPRNIARERADSAKYPDAWQRGGAPVWTTPTAAGVRIAPGIQGGSNWQPMAYSPRTGLMYVRGQNTPNIYRVVRQEREVGDRYDGGIASPVPDMSFATTAAIDPGTGKIKWQTTLEEPGLFAPLGGGSMATAGELVFFGDPRGFLNAVDARTGDVLWRYQMPSWVRATPVMYRIGNTQYVALTSLQGLYVFALPSR